MLYAQLISGTVKCKMSRYNYNEIYEKIAENINWLAHMTQ